MTDMLDEIPLPAIDTELREDESLLDYTQRIRVNALGALTKNGMPEDAKEINSINQILDGIDRQELGKAKLDIEKQGADSDAAAQDLIKAMLNAMGNANPYLAETPVERVIEHEGPVTEGVTLVEGELDAGQRTMNYDAFMKDYKAKNPKPVED